MWVFLFVFDHSYYFLYSLNILPLPSKRVVFLKSMENDIVAGQVREDVLMLGQNVENPTEVLTVVQAFGLSSHSIFSPRFLIITASLITKTSRINDVAGTQTFV